MLIHSFQDTFTTRHVALFNTFGGATLGWMFDMHKWCEETFGHEGERWRDQINSGEVDFRDEKDLMLFLLRWA